MAKDKTASPAGTKPEAEECAFRYNTANLSQIASPLASDKLCKKLYKVIKKATKSKHLRRGVREVAKAIRKGERGFVVLAGDINPIDVITHLPIYCEENSIPYVYVPEKSILGLSAGSKRPTSCLMVSPRSKDGGAFEYKEKYDECIDRIKDLPIPIAH